MINKGTSAWTLVIGKALDQIKKERATKKQEEENLTDFLWNRTRKTSVEKSTPTQSTPTQKKHLATSPAENQKVTPKEKRKKVGSTGTKWIEVLKKQRVKNTRQQSMETALSRIKIDLVPQYKQENKAKKPRPGGLIIKPGAGKTYAEILTEIRQKVKPEDAQTSIKAIRQSRNGCILLELGNNTKNRAYFTEALKTAVGDKGKVEERWIVS